MKIDITKYILLLYTLVLACCTKSETQIIVDEFTLDCPAILPDGIISEVNCNNLINNNCVESQISVSLNLKCDVCLTNAEYEKYKRAHIFVEDANTRIGILVDSLDFTNGYEQTTSFCFSASDRLNSRIISYELLTENGDFRTGLMTFDNLCTTNSKSIKIDRILTLIDFENNKECENFDKFIFNIHPNELEDTLYSIGTMIIGSVGWGYGENFQKIDNNKISNLIETYSQDYEELYLQGVSMPCSGIYIAFNK